MKYLKSNNNQFFTGLKVNVEKYFGEREIDKYGNFSSVFKGTVIVFIYLISYLSVFRTALSAFSLVTAYIIMGVTGVMIVFNIVHDASHKAISKAKWINKCLCFLGDLVGINTYIWDIRHNIQH